MPEAKTNDIPGKRTLWTYRILGVVVAILIAAIPYLIPSDTADDPLWQRFALSGIISMVTLCNLFIPFFQRHTYYFVYGYTFLMNLWLIQLAYLNNFNLDYSPTVFVVLVATSLIYKHFRLLILNLSLLFIFSAALYSVPPKPMVSPFFFMMLELIFMLGIGILMDRQINERASLRQRAGRQRVITLSAFESSDDGILVTDKDGKTLEYNDKFQTIWNLSDAEMAQTKPWAWLDKMLSLVDNSDDLQQVFQDSTAGTEQHVSQVLHLKNGQIMEHFSRPLRYQKEVLGRIWIYKDVTAAEEEKAYLSQQRALLAAENRALSELAANTGVYGGDLGKMLHAIGTRSLEVLQAERACIWLSRIDAREMSCVLRLGYVNERPPGPKSLPMADHARFLGSLTQVRVYPIPDATSDSVTDSFKTADPELTTSAALCVPLRYSGHIIGFIALQDAGEKRDWTPGEIGFASSLGDIGGIVLEATGRKEAEQKLQEKLAVLKSVFEASGIGIMVSSVDNVIMDYNASFLEIWNVSADMLFPGNEKAVLRHMTTILADEEEGIRAYRYLEQNPKEERFDIYKFKDGRIIERSTRVMYVEDKIIGRTWFYRDITQKKRDEEALKASVQRNRAIINAVPDLMLRLGLSGQILQFKMTEAKAFQALATHTPEVLTDLFPEEFAREILELAAEVVATGTTGEVEHQLDFAGQNRDLEIRLSKSKEAEVLALIRDVTKRKNAERELLQRNFELDSFVYRSSHDLKAPLNSLMGLIGILQEEELPPHLVQYIRLMDRSVVKLDTFIRNLTDFSRIARKEIEPEPVDFAAIFTEISEGLDFMEHADRVEKRIHLQADAPMYGDRFHISVVLSNLISNAIKYQDHSKPAPTVDVHIQVGEKEAVLEVRDNGIGIPKEHQGKLFELFFRASTQSFGSGLGLYITKNAIEKIDGKIEIESEAGQGTTFRISLPNHVAQVTS